MMHLHLNTATSACFQEPTKLVIHDSIVNFLLQKKNQAMSTQTCSNLGMLSKLPAFTNNSHSLHLPPKQTNKNDHGFALAYISKGVLKYLELYYPVQKIKQYNRGLYR